MDKAESRRIAGLLGPTMIVMIVSEFPLVQPRLYDMQIPPVVYLSGALMFVAGLAIVRAQPLACGLDGSRDLIGVVRSRARPRADVCRQRVPAKGSHNRAHRVRRGRERPPDMRISDDLQGLHQTRHDRPF